MEVLLSGIMLKHIDVGCSATIFNQPISGQAVKARKDASSSLTDSSFSPPPPNALCFDLAGVDHFDFVGGFASFLLERRSDRSVLIVIDRRIARCLRQKNSKFLSQSCQVRPWRQTQFWFLLMSHEFGDWLTLVEQRLTVCF
ncbi:hypothetical protein NL676_026468 [Syzygium grande]|nr:hypothetical protein NL676_026468 [Syzygium grande]